MYICNVYLLKVLPFPFDTPPSVKKLWIKSKQLAVCVRARAINLNSKWFKRSISCGFDWLWHSKNKIKKSVDMSWLSINYFTATLSSHTLLTLSVVSMHECEWFFFLRFQFFFRFQDFYLQLKRFVFFSFFKSAANALISSDFFFPNSC